MLCPQRHWQLMVMICLVYKATVSMSESSRYPCRNWARTDGRSFRLSMWYENHTNDWQTWRRMARSVFQETMYEGIKMGTNLWNVHKAVQINYHIYLRWIHKMWNPFFVEDNPIPIPGIDSDLCTEDLGHAHAPSLMCTRDQAGEGYDVGST